jgi:two-component system OmpR family sensor kinase
VANLDGTGLTRLGAALDEDQSPPAPMPGELAANARAGGDAEPFTVDSVDGDSSWRTVALPRFDDGLLVVATPLGQLQETLQRMWAIQITASATVLLALGAVSWWVLRLGVRPLAAMAATAGQIAAGDLTRRVEDTDERTEAGRLALALNAMLSEIEGAFRLREASEARLRQFAADASHELRTPLTSIRGYAELWLGGGLRQPEQLDQAMHRLADEGRRMGVLVEDLLLLARLDQQRSAERMPVRLDQLASDAVHDVRVVEPDRPIELTASPITVAGDSHQLRQVVANLVTNALVHTPPGTPIHVRVTGTDTLVRLEVADEGPGMPVEVVARAFERFYRADTSRGRATGGNGLGLSIVQAIVEPHGGTATAISTVGSGSCFTIEFPRPS